MRVIAGSAKGRQLKAPRGETTRPFLDSVKEAVFSIIAFQVPSARVLDLFSGSGSLAIEALSRGAREAVLVESNSKALACLRVNLERTGFLPQASVIRGRLPGAISRLTGKYDLVFVDPPYGMQLVEPVLARLMEEDLVSSGGLILVHQPVREDLPQSIPNLCLVDERTYGQAKLAFYRPKLCESGREQGP